MLASFDMMINYAQLIIYLPSIERIGHQWGDAELRQGFAWSPGIVSLGVPEHAFMCRVELDVVADFELSDEPISCLRVPFDIDETPIQVGSVFSYDPVEIPKGRYSLVYEVLPGQGTWEIVGDGETETGEIDFVLRLWFVSGPDDRFEILKAGGAVHVDAVLSRMTELA